MYRVSTTDFCVCRRLGRARSGRRAVVRRGHDRVAPRLCTASFRRCCRNRRKAASRHKAAPARHVVLITATAPGTLRSGVRRQAWRLAKSTVAQIICQYMLLLSRSRHPAGIYQRFDSNDHLQAIPTSNGLRIAMVLLGLQRHYGANIARSTC